MTRKYYRGRRNVGDNSTGVKNTNNGNSCVLNSFHVILLILSVHLQVVCGPLCVSIYCHCDWFFKFTLTIRKDFKSCRRNAAIGRKYQAVLNILVFFKQIYSLVALKKL